MLAGCPRRLIPADVWELLDYAELYRKGLPPEPGGALDQAAGFTLACRIVWAEQERMKAAVWAKDDFS